MIKIFEKFNEPEIKIYYYSNGQKQSEYWLLNGKYHREDGPANQYWYENGQKEYEGWYLVGKKHREDGSAIQSWYEDGQKEYEFWWLNGENCSRENWVKELKKIGSEHYEEQRMLLNIEKYNL